MLRPFQDVHIRNDALVRQGVDRLSALLPCYHIVRRAMYDIGRRAVVAVEDLRIWANGSHTLRVRHLHVRPILYTFPCRGCLPFVWKAVEQEWKRLRVPVHMQDKTPTWVFEGYEHTRYSLICLGIPRSDLPTKGQFALCGSVTRLISSPALPEHLRGDRKARLEMKRLRLHKQNASTL